MDNSVVDMAYQIIDMHDRIQTLEREVAYYKPYQKMYTDSLNESIAASGAMIGTMLSAAMDPNSVINKGFAAIEAEKSAA